MDEAEKVPERGLIAEMKCLEDNTLFGIMRNIGRERPERESIHSPENKNTIPLKPQLNNRYHSVLEIVNDEMSMHALSSIPHFFITNSKFYVNYKFYGCQSGVFHHPRSQKYRSIFNSLFSGLTILRRKKFAKLLSLPST